MPPSVPVDWVALTAVVMGTLIVLIPVAGITLRFALKPIVEAVGELYRGRRAAEEFALLEKRVAFLEQQLDSLEGGLRELRELGEFDRRLRAPDS